MVNLYGNGLMGRVDVNWEEVETTNERGEPEIGWERYDFRNYYIKDHLGSIRVVVDQYGQITSAQDYYPFGETLRTYTVGSGQNDKYKFTEKERDIETGYDYFGARFYDSRIGRWLSVDPLVHKYPGWSPYNYVLGNPLKLIDEDGNEPSYAGGGDPLKSTLIPPVPFIMKNKETTVTGFTLLGAIIGGTSGGGVGLVTGPGALALSPALSIEGASIGATIGAMVGTFFSQFISEGNSGGGQGRSKNKLQPDKNASGDHSTFKMDKDGNITNTATYTKNPQNPKGWQEVKRVDVTGASHNGVQTPHVHQNRKVDPATTSDLPKVTK